ncbi:MAG: dihydroxy-acid dehydratase [Acidobacteria bacterium]|nr:dihydroxy-acid dehydratase [Acidobacteriota bacterium]
MANDNKPVLRSQDWFGRKDKLGFIHRSWMKSEGFPHEVFDGRPVIGICNSWSELTNCNAHLRQVAEAVKRGVWAAGGFPLEFPTISLGEPFMRPTTMMFRNLMAMDVEESIRANPIDGVVLLCGCDKTTPAQIMGAASADLPSIVVPGGPMLKGRWKNEEIGSGTDVWRFDEERRAGRLSEGEFCDIESCMSRSAGHCMTMGTASTMTSLAEALGLTLTGCANIPAPDSRRYEIAHRSGQRIVEMVHEDLKISKILNARSVDNAIRVDMAIGGSTNAVIHLKAIANRIGLDLPLARFDEISRQVPVILNVKPSGKYLMEDVYYAGGVPAVMKEILGLLDGDALTCTGKSIAENVADAEVHDRDVIRTLDNPIQAGGGTIVLHGNLCPNGAVLKTSAAERHLLQHEGRAVVFENHEDLMNRLDDPDLDVDETCVLVLRNAGPIGGPGMPEVGNMSLPKKVLEKGVRDMLRISDARMSGTSYGAVVLHVSPEAAVGGPLAAVRNGDRIRLDTENRRLDVLIDEHEMNRRLREWQAPEPHYDRGYGRLFLENVLQADEGCDFGFLKGRGAKGKLALPF